MGDETERIHAQGMQTPVSGRGLKMLVHKGPQGRRPGPGKQDPGQIGKHDFVHVRIGPGVDGAGEHMGGGIDGKALGLVKTELRHQLPRRDGKRRHENHVRVLAQSRLASQRHIQLPPQAPGPLLAGVYVQQASNRQGVILALGIVADPLQHPPAQGQPSVSKGPMQPLPPRIVRYDD